MPEDTQHEFQLLRQEQVRLLRTINHDIKSPLYAIKSLTEMFAENPGSFNAEELNTMAVEINRSVSGMGEILDSLLRWMTYQKERYDANVERQDVDEQIFAAMGLVKPQADLRSIAMDFSGSEQIVIGIEKAVQKCIQILLENAIKFSPDNSKIEIRTEPGSQQGLIRIQVQDQGRGLSEKARNQLFNLEERIVSEGVRGEKGAGLGLLMAQDILKRSSGTLGAGEAEHGAIFYFELPLAGDNI